jgi:glucose/arabinose dehydrogenase
VLAAIATGVAMLVPATAADAAPTLTDGVALEVVASGLSLAVDLTAPPGDDRLFVVEKVGRIRIIENGVVLAQPFLDIRGPVLSAANEQGLLGLAFPPDYASSGLFYVYYTSDAGNGDSTVAEYSVGANRNVADAGSGRILLTADQPFTNHNGGAIQIGPDGYLYVALGDGGSGGDPRGNGQNKSTLLGAILRLDPATGAAAPGNPFIGTAGADEIWAWGLRNPWRFSFDPATGDMFIADVGQSEIEEIDVLPAGVGGTNFGWNTYEGSDCYNGPCAGAGLAFPVHEYRHRSGGVCGGSITGGYVYRGNELPWLRGHYFYADWCHSDDLKSFRMRGGRAVDHIDWGAALAVPGFITSFGTDGFGELYFLAQGKVYKFVSERNPECDFNGDGFADIAVGAPGESHSAAASAGLVQEFRGSSGPFDPADDRTWRQNRGGLGGTPGAGDLFGSALACGDFNADGFWDLAVGVPGEGAGSIQTLYGSAAGLSADQSDHWTQATLGVGDAVVGDRFGAALASGDFNRDGYADLAIGAPDDGEAGPSASGSVTAVFGGPGGLSPTGAILLHQDSPSIRGVAAAGDQLGASVASGDIDGDGYFDIVAGAPGDTVSGKARAGSVAVVFGKRLGIGPRDFRLTRDSPGIKGRSRAGARWGVAVATGSFDGDGFDDIAIGVEGRNRTGAVQVIFGNGAGLRRDGIYREGSAGTPGVAEAGDRFGAALAAGDSDGDGYDELAVGVPGESHSRRIRAGMVVVFAGSRTGLAHHDPGRFHQNTSGIKGVAGVDDEFGAALRFLDTRGDGRVDLVVGAPGDNIGGQVALIPGKVGGLSPAGDALWSQDTPGVGGIAETGDRFGAAL